ncbi:hypothetical protein LXA43DRAFT_1040201 [Ganoderma leucocontextum]|nr:hypothetical protein LXA43DRAFT_1040201 [Ganoderma leucocontextum]
MSSSSSASEPHPTLYFPNGDVVLSALIDSEAPPTTRLFRVHKFLLMHHSATFANMFADAKPGSGESYDGVPMVELQGDKAEDLALLLNYLYNPTQMTFKRFDPNTPLAVSGVIRLADKYCIESLREHFIKVVISDWPTTLKEWDIFQIEIKAAKEKIALTNAEKEGPDPSDFDHLRDHIPEPASAIAFAQEFGCHQILPAAYYQLSTIEPYHGWNNNWQTSEPCARWELLSKDNLLRYIRGSNHLLVRNPHEVDFLSSPCYPPRAVMDHEAYVAVLESPCAVFFRHLIAKQWNARTGGLNRDPLAFLSRCLEYYASDIGRENVPGMPCDYCDMSFRDIPKRLRSNIWALLPRYFDIDESL